MLGMVALITRSNGSVSFQPVQINHVLRSPSLKRRSNGSGSGMATSKLMQFLVTTVSVPPAVAHIVRALPDVQVQQVAVHSQIRDRNPISRPIWW